MEPFDWFSVGVHTRKGAGRQFFRQDAGGPKKRIGSFRGAAAMFGGSRARKPSQRTAQTAHDGEKGCALGPKPFQHLDTGGKKGH
jgi:hypothetical protein